MSSCAIKWCGNSSRNSNYTKNGITFHRFPKDPERKSKWIDATCRGNDWFPSNNSVVCSRHFTEDNFYTMKTRRRLMDTAIPSLFLPILTSNSPKPSLVEKDPEVVASTSPPVSTSPLLISSNKTTRKIYDTLIEVTPSAFNSPIGRRLSRRILELENCVKRKNLHLKRLCTANGRLKKKIMSLKLLLIESGNKNLISAKSNQDLSSLGVKRSELIRQKFLKAKSEYGYSGFNMEAFEALKFKVEPAKTPIYCCIVFDEMKMKSKIENLKST